MLGDAGRSERGATKYVPYIGHIGTQTVLLEDGSLLATAHIAGHPFELEDHADRNTRFRLLNTLYRNLADDNVTVYTHLIRHADTQSHAAEKFRSKIGRSFPSVPDGLARELEDQWHILANGLESFLIRRLGVYERGGIVFSEIAETLRLIITGRHLPVPIISGHLGDSIYTDRVICGRRGIEIRAPDKSTYGTIFSFREYPAKTRPGMLNTLLSAPFPLVLSQSFGFVTRAQAQCKLSLKSAQIAYAKAHKHPELTDQTVWQVFEAERAHLVPVANKFDGFHGTSASVSKTCLVRFDNNKYSVASRAVGRPVEIQAYADRIVLRQDGAIVAEHPRCMGRGQTIYDPWHYVPVLACKPGALRNGAPFKDWLLPSNLERERRKLRGADDG